MKRGTLVLSLVMIGLVVLYAAAVLVIVIIVLVGRGVYPALVQKFKVVPNEVVLERPYLEHNIRFTRLAYGIDAVEEQELSRPPPSLVEQNALRIASGRFASIGTSSMPASSSASSTPA